MEMDEQLTACFTTRSPSKYEEKGDFFRRFLKNRKDTNEFSTFYEYQIEAVLRTQAHLISEDGTRKRSDPVALIVAPTGSGKSGMIVLLPYVLKSRKVLVLTPSISISQQLARAFGIENKDDSFFYVTGFSKLLKTEQVTQEEILGNLLANGRIIRDAQDTRAEIKARHHPLVIVNAQKFGGKSNTTLKYNDKDMVEDVREFFRQFDTLIVDEAHHYPAETWEIILNEFQKPSEGMKKQIIFFTATPFRNRGGNPVPILDNQRQKIVYEIKNSDVVGITVRGQEFIEEKQFSIPNLHADIIRLLDENATLEPRIMKHQAIILVHTTQDAEEYAQRLNDIAGNNNFAVAIVRTVRKEEVQKRISDFTDGCYQVAVNCKLLTEGYDNTSVTVGVILKKVKSKIMFNQFIGRCMRMKKFTDPPADKSIAKILSYKEFEQETNFKTRNDLASEDPTDEGLTS